MYIRIAPNPDPDRVGTMVTISEGLDHDGSVSVEFQTNNHVIIEHEDMGNDLTFRKKS